MKFTLHHFLYFAFLFCLVSCTTPTLQKSLADTETAQLAASPFPSELQQVFEKHGGIDRWKAMQTMSYEIEKETGNEKQFISLWDRREKIEASNFSMGYDGSIYWLTAGEDYKGNPKFYKGLMFYFYAMPFVLADEGIVYAETEPITYEGKSYPGIRISYGAEVGLSPEDEYFIHYDPETFQMAWLGYTVTYSSQVKSDNINWIRYDDWGNHNGLYLPHSLTWFKVDEAGKLLEPRKTRKFVQIQVSEEAFAPGLLDKPADAEIVD